jgi:hypothetical protein
MLPQVQRSPLELFSFKNIWKCGAPSKVSALSWQVFLDRVPTKVNLYARNVIPNDEVRCPWCQVGAENSQHLFLHCSFAANIWYAVMRWLGVVVVLPPNVMLSYGGLVAYGTNKKLRKGFSLVWLTFVWAIWKFRNDRVFNNIIVGESVVVDYIQRTSWKWHLSKNAKGTCLLYEWVWEPGLCMMH